MVVFKNQISSWLGYVTEGFMLYHSRLENKLVFFGSAQVQHLVHDSDEELDIDGNNKPLSNEWLIIAGLAVEMNLEDADNYFSDDFVRHGGVFLDPLIPGRRLEFIWKSQNFILRSLVEWEGVIQYYSAFEYAFRTMMQFELLFIGLSEALWILH